MRANVIKLLVKSTRVNLHDLRFVSGFLFDTTSISSNRIERVSFYRKTKEVNTMRLLDVIFGP